MATSFMKKMKSTASKIITRFGTTCTVKTINKEEFSAKIAFTNGNKQDGENTHVQDYDRTAFMTDTTIQPKSGDLVYVGEDVWRVVRSSEYSPGNAMNAAWKLELKA